MAPAETCHQPSTANKLTPTDRHPRGYIPTVSTHASCTHHHSATCEAGQHLGEAVAAALAGQQHHSLKRIRLQSKGRSHRGQPALALWWKGRIRAVREWVR